jgi:hypothetical protein
LRDQAHDNEELDDGTLLTEGAAIVQYIANRVPSKKLAPLNGTIERTKLQSWLNFFSSELHKGGFSPLFYKGMPENGRRKASFLGPIRSLDKKRVALRLEVNFRDWCNAYKQPPCGLSFPRCLGAVSLATLTVLFRMHPHRVSFFARPISGLHAACPTINTHSL